MLELEGLGAEVADLGRTPVLDRTRIDVGSGPCPFLAVSGKILERSTVELDEGLADNRLKQPAESALLFCYENEDQQPIKAVLRALPEDVHRITVLVIEHNLDVIKTADYLIDLGPEGGDGGGTLVACGTPEAVAEIPESYTGQYLKSYLK